MNLCCQNIYLNKKVCKKAAVVKQLFESLSIFQLIESTKPLDWIGLEQQDIPTWDPHMVPCSSTLIISHLQINVMTP